MVYLVQSKEDLDQRVVEAGNKLIVIDFYANWCGPCKIISPKLEELSQQYADQAVVLKVNVDENEEIAIQYNVTSMPTFVFIKKGAVIDIFVGCNSEKLAKSMEKFVTADGDREIGSERHHDDDPEPCDEESISDSEVCALSTNESETADVDDATANATANDGGVIEAIDQEN